MHMPSLVKIFWYLLKLLSANENTGRGMAIRQMDDRHTDVQHETTIPNHYPVAGYKQKDQDGPKLLI